MGTPEFENRERRMEIVDLDTTVLTVLSWYEDDMPYYARYYCIGPSDRQFLLFYTNDGCMGNRRDENENGNENEDDMDWTGTGTGAG